MQLDFYQLDLLNVGTRLVFNFKALVSYVPLLATKVKALSYYPAASRSQVHGKTGKVGKAGSTDEWCCTHHQL